MIQARVPTPDAAGISVYLRVTKGEQDTIATPFSWPASREGIPTHRFLAMGLGLWVWGTRTLGVSF